MTTATVNEVASYDGTHLQAVVTTAPDGGAVLVWNDYVVNEWTERHTTLAAALVRLAVLVDLDTGDGNGYFTEMDADAFAEVAGAFVAGRWYD